MQNPLQGPGFVLLSAAGMFLLVLMAEFVLASLGNYTFAFQCSIIQTMGMLVERVATMRRFDVPSVDGKVVLSDRKRALKAPGFARAGPSISVISPRELAPRGRAYDVTVDYWAPFERGEKDVIAIDGDPMHINYWGYLAPARTRLHQIHIGDTKQQDRKQGHFIMSSSSIRHGSIFARLIEHRHYVDELVDEFGALLDAFFPRP